MTPTNPTIIDSFNRADENPATNWTALAGAIKVVSNQAAGNAVTDNLAFYSPSTQGPDVDITIPISVREGNNNYVAVLARLKDTGSIATLDGYLVGHYQLTGTDAIRVYRLDNAVGTQLGADISQESAAGDLLNVTIVGSTIQVWYFNGTSWALIGTRTDSTYPAAGSVGLGIYNTTGRVDYYQGGLYVPFPPIPRRLGQKVYIRR